MKLETKKTILIYTLLLVVVTLLFSSCKKQDPLVPMEQVPETQNDTIPWQDQYNNGGTLPTGGGSTTDNQLVGTTWVLTKTVSKFLIWSFIQ